MALLMRPRKPRHRRSAAFYQTLDGGQACNIGRFTMTV